MSFTQTGTCPTCGAGIYVPTVWHAVVPPPSYYTCSCSRQENQPQASNWPPVGSTFHPSPSVVTITNTDDHAQGEEALDQLSEAMKLDEDIVLKPTAEERISNLETAVLELVKKNIELEQKLEKKQNSFLVKKLGLLKG